MAESIEELGRLSPDNTFLDVKLNKAEGRPEQPSNQTASMDKKIGTNGREVAEVDQVPTTGKPPENTTIAHAETAAVTPSKRPRFFQSWPR